MRALAVLPIVAFHLGFYRLSGGYVGVDIFFVISGYLIGGIVLNQIHRKSWSVVDFYVRRFRRIVPALAFALFATTAVAWFVLLPNAFADYGKSLVATTLFSSNFYFWQTSSYFASASDAKPLLHTWSLAVEEQYYIVFPLLMLAIRRFGRSAMHLTIATVALASLIASAVLIRSDPTATFYLLPTRVWELLLGVLAVETHLRALDKRRTREWVASAGLLLIAVPILLYKPDTPFPGLAAIPPCLGAAILLVAGAHGTSFVSRLLGLRPIVFFGLISYSLYLWHWPVIVLLKQGLPVTFLRLPLKIGAFVASTAVAWISWRLIERPWRNPSVRPRAILIGTFASGIVLCAVGGAIMIGQGVPARFATSTVRLASIQDDDSTNDFRTGTCFISSAYTFDDFEPSRCLRRDTGRINVALIGDSHAAHLWQGLSQRYPMLNVLQATASGCKPVIERDADAEPRCDSMMRFVFDRYLPQHPVGWVIIAGNWSANDASKVAATLEWLRAHKFRVVLAGPIVRYAAPLPQLLAIAEQRGDQELVARNREQHGLKLDAIFREIAAQHGADYFSLYGALCGSADCRVTDAQGLPIQFDYGHLTGRGSYIVAESFPISRMISGPSRR